MPTEPTRRLHYVIEGAADKPVLVMSNSLGTTLDMWGPQMAALTAHYRVLRYDTRGHGRSALPSSSFGMRELAEDVIAIMDHAGIERAHFCGLSMGGMTGMYLARHHAGRFGRFVLANTAALIGPESVWNTRIETVRRDGMAAIVNGVLARWFTDHYVLTRRDEYEPVRRMLTGTSAEGYVANCAAVRDADLRGLLPGVQAPVLVIAGEQDLATTAAQGQEVARAIPGAEYLELAAAHLSNWELPEAFGNAVIGFLRQK
ncbi:3-oxoadipate enol-lactonase [Cupriavidus metallidurans]|uniref:3-oxoadipate enol-lactonase n=1 Tax=Cupriavidus TaxID=106589 RepID=UPI000E87AB93|nr:MULTISPECIES: 3-oxoadipate enol-lactonase [Cupriavidus]GMG93959.1 3-oxoadipate enol-lactonase [Cupriavidus sp. TKC]HBD36854.1 3-oxoadipate enol-lactonase [Cupriavidus sp.]HBO83266.1 3-oxoadipate enol-lactonase [Cupriavidus sp.]